MALAAQTVLNRRLPLLAVALLAGCVSAPPPRPEPPPQSLPPVAPAPPPALPPAQPLPRPQPPAPAVVRPGPPPSAPAAPAPAPAPSATQRSTQPTATGSLVALADRQAAAGDYASAAAQLERALRIRPQDPLLWQQLAWLRLRNGQFEQAATLAARSDSLAGNNADVRARNRRIMDMARARQRPGE